MQLFIGAPLLLLDRMNSKAMPWQTILNAFGATDGSTLERLGKAIRAALGIGEAGVFNRPAFTAAVVALSAKLSISDGVSLKIEEETFERMFSFEPDEAENVRWLFRLAAKDTAGYETYARELARALAGHGELLRDVFEALMHVASADGVLHEAEDRYLGEVASLFGYSREKYLAIRARFVHVPGDPYEVLGVSRDLSDVALKGRYRELVRKNHPDTAAGRGLPKEVQDFSAKKLAAINAAWDQIARERGL